MGASWGLLDPFHERASTVSDDAVLAAMLEVETALFTASAQRHGHDGWRGADALRSVLCDVDALIEGTRTDGVPVPELVRQLRDTVERSAPDAAAFVHDGATSQDVVDTALVLVAKRTLGDARDRLVVAGHALARLALAEAGTVTMGRTLAQAAAATTLGVQIARWVDGVAAALDTLDRLRFPVQLGGAVGVDGRDRAAFARLLELDDPGRSWHVERSPVLAIGQAAATVIAALAHLGRDLTQLVRPELGFVRLAGGGDSSAMPHKRNPVDAILLVSAGLRAPGALATLHSAAVSVDSRPAGEWHAEWSALRELLALAVGSAAVAADAAAGLSVDHRAIGHDSEEYDMPVDSADGPREAFAIVDDAVARFAAVARSDPRDGSDGGTPS
ncbi:MAG TPA: lyase family protein [Rhodoglobus sp.]|nr:lyase family protein [Rhodoglobus sp.]